MKDPQVEHECSLQPSFDRYTQAVEALQGAARTAGDAINRLADRYGEHSDKLAELADEINGVVDTETGEITVDGIKPRLDVLAGRVDKLTETLDQLAEKKSKGQRNWFRVQKADEATKWLTGLQQWLDEEYAYVATRVPACWPWHPAAVADLLALQDHYNEAYKGSSPVSVTDLWARALAATKARLAEHEVLGRCTVELTAGEWVYKHCRDMGSGKKNIDAASTAALIPTYATWWVSGRDPAVEPQPVQQQTT